MPCKMLLVQHIKRKSGFGAMVQFVNHVGMEMRRVTAITGCAAGKNILHLRQIGGCRIDEIGFEHARHNAAAIWSCHANRAVVKE